MAPDRFVGGVSDRARQLMVDDPDLCAWLVALGAGTSPDEQRATVERVRETLGGEAGAPAAPTTDEPQDGP